MTSEQDHIPGDAISNAMGKIGSRMMRTLRNELTIGTVTPVHRICVEIVLERERQDERWGEQNHLDGTGPEEPLLPGWTARELADAARSACQLNADLGIVTWRDVFGEEACEALAESDPVRLRAELVQVAAVAVAWIQAIDRRTPGIHEASTEGAQT